MGPASSHHWPMIHKGFTSRSRAMGIGMKELLIILLVVLLVFGAKKLKTIGSDLGSAVRGFKKSMSDGEEEGMKQSISSDAPDARIRRTPEGREERPPGLTRPAGQTAARRCSRSALPNPAHFRSGPGRPGAGEAAARGRTGRPLDGTRARNGPPVPRAARRRSAGRRGQQGEGRAGAGLRIDGCPVGDRRRSSRARAACVYRRYIGRQRLAAP